MIPFPSDTGCCYLDWLTFDRPVTREYAVRRAELCAEMGVDVHCYFVQVGGTMIYPSRICGQSPSLDFDLLEALVEEDHKRGVCFVAGWLGTLPGNALLARQHPDWLARGPKTSEQKETQLTYMCYNSPFREHQAEQVREVLSGYEVDGIYFDQIMTGCFCDYCKRDFQLMYRYPLPEDAAMAVHTEASLYNEAEDVQKGLISQSAATHLRDFTDRKTEAWLANLRGVIATTRPEAKLCSSHLSGRRAPLARRYCDVICAEQIRTDTSDVRLLSLERQISAVYARKPIWEGMKYDNYGWRSRPATHVEVLMAEAAANGAKPWLRDQNALDLDPPAKRQRVVHSMRVVSGIVRESAAARSLGYAALLHTFEDQSDTYFDSFAGMYRLLSQAHLPVDPVPVTDVAEGGLAGFKLAVVLSPFGLSAEVVDSIAAFLNEGGAILATDLAVCDSDSASGPLAQLMGIRPQTVWTNIRTVLPAMPGVPIPTMHPADFYFARISKATHPISAGMGGCQLDFEAPYVQADVGSATVLADVLAFDQEAIMARPFDRRIPKAGKPQHPLLVVDERPWRMAYFGTSVGSPGTRTACIELDELLLRTVRWCGGDSPLRCANIPHTVRVVVRSMGKRLFVHLNNLPDNIVPDQHIRHVVPVDNLEINIGPVSGSVQACVAANGGEVACDLSEGRVTVRLRRLEVFEILTLDGLSVDSQP